MQPRLGQPVSTPSVSAETTPAPEIESAPPAPFSTSQIPVVSTETSTTTTAPTPSVVSQPRWAMSINPMAEISFHGFGSAKMTLPPGTQTVEQRPVPVNANAFPPPQGIRAANPGPTTERSNVLGGAQANQTQFHQPRCPTTQYFSVFGRRFVSTTSLWQPNLSYQSQNMVLYYPGLNFIPQHHPAQQDMCETCDPQVSCGVELGASLKSPQVSPLLLHQNLKNFKKKILAL